MSENTPAMLAAADQSIAIVGENLRSLVDFYREEDATGTDRTELVATMTALMIKQSHPSNVAALLAVAMGRLAFPVPCTSCPDCARSALASALLEA